MKDSNFLKENNARHLWHPMGHPGELRRNAPRIITGAEGVHIIDIDGNRAVDAMAGLWNVNLGYSNAAVKRAIAEQLERLPYYSAFAGSSTDVAIELSWELRQWAKPEGMGRAFFTSGGSDSVETALRLARQYHKLRGEPARSKFLSLKKGYHGTHFGGASVNGNARFRTAYEPLLPGCFHLPAPWTYRNPFGEDDPARLAQKILAVAEDEIAFQDPSTIAALIMEPILGAGGVIVPHESFMPGIRELCDRHGIVLIADEVITGFGRTGDWFGTRHWGVRPDMMTTAKAITSGYFPFGAVMVSEAMAEVFESDETDAAFIGHGYTYSAHPAGAAAALACLAETRRLKLDENAAARGAQLFAGLERLKERHALVGDVRGGHGLMAALEFVTDRASREPVPAQSVLDIQRATFEAGAMVRPLGNCIVLSPPLTCTAEDIDTILAALEAGISAA
jgi:hypothetical protein